MADTAAGRPATAGAAAAAAAGRAAVLPLGRADVAVAELERVAAGARRRLVRQEVLLRWVRLRQRHEGVAVLFPGIELLLVMALLVNYLLALTYDLPKNTNRLVGTTVCALYNDPGKEEYLKGGLHFRP